MPVPIAYTIVPGVSCVYGTFQVFGIAAGRGPDGNASVRSLGLRPLRAGLLGETGPQGVRGKQRP